MRSVTPLGPPPTDDGAHLTSLDDRAYLQLRGMIVRGTLRPGEQLVQETLAEHLGLSRTPLRKAIATLAQEGFVEMTSRGAAFVRSFTDEELASIWEIRAVLEGLVCRTAARRAKAHHVAYLRSLITSAIERVTPGDWSAYQEADREFHSYIASVVDDPLLTRILDAYQILSITLAQGLLRPPEETLPEHLEILDAIEAEDAERAERAMVHHIRSSLAHLRLPSRGGDGRSLPGNLVPVARPILEALAAATGETAFIGFRDAEEVVVLAAAESERMLRVACPVGSRLPGDSTAAGKVLRPGRRKTGSGHRKEVGEHEEGVWGLAVPLERRGRTIAALSLLVPAERLGARESELLRALESAAGRIEGALGG